MTNARFRGPRRSRQQPSPRPAAGRLCPSQAAPPIRSRSGPVRFCTSPATTSATSTFPSNGPCSRSGSCSTTGARSRRRWSDARGRCPASSARAGCPPIPGPYVLHDGPLLRMDVEQLEGAKLKSLSIRHLFARYADCLMAQVFQSVACNAAHSIEQRAAKWLVSAMERTSDSRVPLTQEQLADMLGVGRSYVSRVIQSLKARRPHRDPSRRPHRRRPDGTESARLRLPGLRSAVTSRKC